MTLVSVLLPTRGRPAHAGTSVASLLGNASDPGALEILAGLDPDDPAWPQGGGDMPFAGEARVRAWYAPRRYGYHRIHEYLNALAGMAGGEWLMLWNDDATMLTPGWDEVIASEQPGVLWPQADYAPQINTFPIWPRSWFTALGHVSADQSADMWMAEVGRMSATMRKIPVSIHHEHLGGDQTAAERDAVASVATFHRDEMRAARERDAAVITELAR